MKLGWLGLGLLPSPFLLAVLFFRFDVLEETRRRVKRIEEEATRCQVGAQRQEALKAREEVLGRDLRTLEDVLPPAFELPEIATAIGRLTGSGSASVAFEEIVEKEFYRELPWQIFWHAGLAECRRFVEAVEAETQLHRVTGFRYEHDGSRCTVFGQSFASVSPEP